QRKAGADIGRESEKLQLLAELAMVALLRFFEAIEIGRQFLVVAPRRSVDALQLRIVGVAAPVSARDLGQLERLSDLARGSEMRPAAEVVPVAVEIDRH